MTISKDGLLSGSPQALNTLVDRVEAEIAQIAGISAEELAVINEVTAGTVAASKAVVVDANKDASAFRTVGVVNLDAGSSGVAGTVDVFPTTASKGKFALACTDQSGDTTVTLNANAMGQATTVNISDPEAAASYVVQSTAALSLAEVDKLDDMSATKNDLIETSKLIANVSLVLSSGGSTTQTITGTLKDADANTIAEQRKLTVIMVTDAEGDTASAAGANTSAEPTTGTALITHTAKLAFEVMTHTDGTFVMTFDNAGGGQSYTDRLAVYIPHTGKAVVSAALNVAHE